MASNTSIWERILADGRRSYNSRKDRLAINFAPIPKVLGGLQPPQPPQPPPLPPLPTPLYYGRFRKFNAQRAALTKAVTLYTTTVHVVRKLAAWPQAMQSTYARILVRLESIISYKSLIPELCLQSLFLLTKQLVIE